MTPKLTPKSPEEDRPDPEQCVCGGIDMGGGNFDLDVRPDCPVHGDLAPADWPASGHWITAEDPF